MDVRDVVFGVAGRTRLGYGSPFCDVLAALDEECAEMGQRDLVPAPGGDRDREAVRGDPPGECNLPGHRSANDARFAQSDVDTTVLSAGVGVIAERERAEDVAVGRPRPGLRARRGGEHPPERECHADGTPCCL